MTLQTVAAMRAFLPLSSGLTDEQVIEQYGAYLAGLAATPVLTLDAVKRNLRVDDDDEDDLIGDLIIAAQEHVEDYTGLILTPRTVTETAPRLASFLEIAAWPVSAITAITYSTSGGDVLPIDPVSWRVAVGRRPVRVIPLKPYWGVQPDTGGSWGRLDYCAGALPASHVELPVEITISAGYATPELIPATIRQAMHLLISHFYHNREATEVGTRAAAIEIPFGVQALLRKHRLELV